MRDIIGLYLSPLDLSPFNSYMMYLQILMTFSARSYEDHVASATPLLSFTIN